MLFPIGSQREADQIEQLLESQWLEAHRGVMAASGKRSTRGMVGRISGAYWKRLQASGRFETWPQHRLEEASRELNEEAADILVDYEALTLEGFQFFVLFCGLMTVVSLFADGSLPLLVVAGILVLCVALYPVLAYSAWQFGRLHPFKRVKLVLAAAASCVAIVALYRLSGSLGSDWEQLFLTGRFNLTQLLLLINLAVILEFMIYYRRMNLLNELVQEVEHRTVAFSALGDEARKALTAQLAAVGRKPLRTRIRKRFKRELIASWESSGELEAPDIGRFVRERCIRLDWRYWAATGIQGFLVLLLVQKAVVGSGNGMILMADYLDQPLLTGHVAGIALCGFLWLPRMNYLAREVVYGGKTLREATPEMLLTAVALAAVLWVTGLIPGGWQWGYPMNPAPYTVTLASYLGLCLFLQFIKPSWLEE